MRIVFLIAGLVVLLSLILVGCGRSSVDNEMIGQPKKLIRRTPILCFNRTDLDISLGVLRNGVGSVSTADELLTVPREEDRKTLARAIEAGQLVKLHYDVYRITFCWQDHAVTDVEILP